MKNFAVYRLPYEDKCTMIRQIEGEPLSFDSCSKLNGHAGFVIAPFTVTSEQPIWLIRADEVKEMDIDEMVTDEGAAVPNGGSRVTPSSRTVPSPSDEYARDFECFHSKLASGVFSKIVLGRSAVYTFTEPTNPLKLFQETCRSYPRLFIALTRLPSGEYWLTATPEILLDGVGKQWRTIALAGTMQLEKDDLSFDVPPSVDGKSPIDIRWSTKNIQEQRYVASYIGECLKQFDIDFQEEGPRTVRAANLVHLRSDFTFTIENTKQVGSLLDVLHPTPAVCGIPKQEVHDFIVANEHSPRDYYCGFMGVLGETTHLYVSLRCMKISDNQCRLYAGGGLLKESIMEQEWMETEAKMQTMKRLLND